MSLVKRRLRFHLFHTTNRMNQQNGLEKKNLYLRYAERITLHFYNIRLL